MKKIDKILKTANIFEKLSNCETKKQMRKVLAQSQSTPLSSPTNFNEESQYPDGVKEFQERITSITKKDPKFKEHLNLNLSKNNLNNWMEEKNDEDGLVGPRTKIAKESYDSYYNYNINMFQEELQRVYDECKKYTNNFSKKTVKDVNEFINQYMSAKPYLAKAYWTLNAAYSNGLLSTKLGDNFLSLSIYFKQIAEACKKENSPVPQMPYLG